MASSDSSKSPCCWAPDPNHFCLRKPWGGLGIEESSRMVELIRRMAQNQAILLVEHDMDAVFQLARVLTVMVDGRVLASGKPDEVRADEQVQCAYLGNFDEYP